MYGYQPITVNEELSDLDIEIIKSKTGDLIDRLGLTKFQQMMLAFNELKTRQEWRSFILDFELLRIYRSPGGYGDWQNFIENMSIRTIPRFLWEKDVAAQKFISLQGEAKQTFFDSQMQVNAALWLQAPVFWISKSLVVALNDTKHPGNIPELKLPARSFIVALPEGALVAPGGASVSFLICTAYNASDGDKGASIVAWLNDRYCTEYFLPVKFSSWEDRGSIEVRDLGNLIADEDRDRENGFMFEISSFTAKLLLYFNTPAAETSDLATRQRRIKKHPYTTKPTDLWSPNIIGDRLPSYSTSEWIGRESRGQRAHIVRGHFHAFRTGRGRTETKVNWLMPYWKGVSGED